MRLLAIAILIFAFADLNGNGVIDAGETYVAGQYEIFHEAEDGAVWWRIVNYPVGVPYQLEVEAGSYRIVSGCGEQVFAASAAPDIVFVPVVCGSVWLPIVGGEKR